MAKTELTGKQIKDQSVDLAVDVNGVLPVANGGSGSNTIPLNNVILGNGSGAFQSVAPGSAGNVLVSNGDTWISSSAAGSGDVTSNTSTSVNNELVLFSGTGGKSIKRATATGYAYLNAGVLSAASEIPQSAITNLGTALDSKAAAIHTHSQSDVTGLTSSLSGISTALDSKEPTINAGAAGQYWDGTKSWQSLNKTAVGLGNVDNTSDANKPISTATQTALNAKVNNSSVGTANGVASLDSNGKVPGSQLPNSIMTYEGTHNVSTNSPSLTDGTGEAGQVYRISFGGTRNYGSGNIVLNVGDYLIHSGSVWEKADTTDAVSSIAGRTGDVTLTTADVSGAVSLTGAETLTQKTLTNPTINGYTEGSLALGTVGATATLSIVDDSIITATLTASTACTFTMPTVAIGKSFTLFLRQAATTGNGTATFTGVKWGVTGTPTMTATAGRMDIFTFFSDGTNWYGSAAQGFVP